MQFIQKVPGHHDNGLMYQVEGEDSRRQHAAHRPIMAAQMTVGKADGRDDGRGSVRFAEMIEHHRRRPYLRDRIGDALAENVGRRAMHWLEHRRIVAFRVDIGRRG